MDSRVTRIVAFLGIVAALMLGLVLGTMTGIANGIFGGSNPKTIASASLESMRAQNRLTAFAARYVSVVTTSKQELGGLVSSERTLILPGDVRYELDLSKLQPRDVSWDAPTHTLRVQLPEVEIAGPDVDINAVKEYGGGNAVGADQRRPAARLRQPRARRRRFAQAGDRRGADAARAPGGALGGRAQLRDAARGGRLHGRESGRALPDRRDGRA